MSVVVRVRVANLLEFLLLGFGEALQLDRQGCVPVQIALSVHEHHIGDSLAVPCSWHRTDLCFLDMLHDSAMWHSCLSFVQEQSHAIRKGLCQGGLHR